MKFIDELHNLILNAEDHPKLLTPTNRLRWFLYDHAAEIAAIVSALEVAANELHMARYFNAEQQARAALDALEAKQ